MTYDEFCQLIRAALHHLYDYPYLDDHPLALQVRSEGRWGGPGRAQRLSRLLLEAIEDMNPPGQSAVESSHARYYALLVSRFVEERPLPEILRELGYSRSQFYREQQKAITMLSSMLWSRFEHAASAPDGAPTSAPDGAPASGLDGSPASAPDAPPASAPDTLPASAPDTLPASAPNRSPASAPNRLLDAEVERVLAQRETLDAAEVAYGVLDLVGPLAAQHRITLTADLDDDLPPIMGNRTLLRQVLLKGLSSLIAAPGTREILMRLRCQGQDAVLEWLTRPADPTDTADRRESALAPVQQLVDRIGGRWRPTTRLGDAWICGFDLPLGGETTLLVIEDNEGFIRVFEGYLAGYHYRVIGATTAGEALQCAREQRPDAITLDIMLPGQDGWEILQRLKRDPLTRSIPVIICSILEDPALAFSLGAAAYLQKPISRADLLDVLGRLCGGALPSGGGDVENGPEVG